LVSVVVVVVEASVVAAGAAAVVSVETVVVLAESVVVVVASVAGASTVVVSVVSAVFDSHEASVVANTRARAETFRRFFILVVRLKKFSLKNFVHTVFVRR
jgi:hypothetical protein